VPSFASLGRSNVKTRANYLHKRIHKNSRARSLFERKYCDPKEFKRKSSTGRIELTTSTSKNKKSEKLKSKAFSESCLAVFGEFLASDKSLRLVVMLWRRAEVRILPCPALSARLPR